MAEQTSDHNNIQEKQEILLRSYTGKPGLPSVEWSLDIFRERISLSAQIKDQTFRSVIIPLNMIPFYIVLDEDLILKAETWLKTDSPVAGDSIEKYQRLKEYYIKWLFAEKESEIIRYSKAIREITSQSPDERNFPFLILNIVYNIFERKNLNEVIHLISRSKRTIEQSRASTDLKNRLLFVLTMLSGVYYLREGDYSNSNLRFTESLSYYPDSVTSKFFTALTFVKTGLDDKAFMLAREIFLYDNERLNYLIENNNQKSWEYFLNYPEFVHVILNQEFAPLYEKFGELFSEIIKSKNISSEILLQKMEELKKLQLQDLYSPGITNSLSFVQTIIAYLHDDYSLLYRVSLGYLNEKLSSLINMLLLLVKSNYGLFLERKIERIEGEIVRSGNEIESLLENIETEKKKTEEILRKSLIDLEFYTKGVIEYNRGLLENFERSNKEKPGKIFKKSMITGCIISAAVAALSLAAFNSGGDFSASVINALKLGVLSIAVGGVISLFNMFISIFTSGREKKKLIEKISSQYTIQEEEAEKLRKRESEDLKRKSLKLERNISEIKEKIIKLENEKQQLEYQYRYDIDSQINLYQEKLLKIIQMNK